MSTSSDVDAGTTHYLGKMSNPRQLNRQDMIRGDTTGVGEPIEAVKLYNFPELLILIFMMVQHEVIIQIV